MRSQSKIIVKLIYGCFFLATSSLLNGCNFDLDGIQYGAEKLKQEVESSNLMECQDKEGKPLPEWVCRRDSERRRIDHQLVASDLDQAGLHSV